MASKRIELNQYQFEQQYDKDRQLLFIKPDCEKCKYVMEKVEKWMNIEVIDTTTVEGTAKMAYHELMSFYPPLLIYDGQLYNETIKIVHAIRTIKPEENDEDNFI